MAPSKTPALAFNHVGLTVPDIFAAIDWYGKVFEATHIMGLRLLAAAEKGDARNAWLRRGHIALAGAARPIIPPAAIATCRCYGPVVAWPGSTGPPDGIATP
jgi:catechol 2,3-dioxygenase-like lactoylglutathione lyase family enzyme